MAKIESTVIDGHKVKIGSKRHAELTGASTYQTAGGSTKPTPITEPSVISTESAVKDVNKANDTLDFLSGKTIPTTDSKQTQDKTTTDTSVDSLTKLFEQDGTPLPAELSDAGKAARAELDSIVAGLDTFKIANAELQNNIKSIVSGYDARIAQFEDINARREKTFETLGFRTGGQFSGGIRGGVFGGIIAEEERQGLSRINELEAAKQSDIVQAKESARSQNWDVYVQQVQAADEKYKEQIANIEKLNKLYIDHQDKLKEEKEAIDKINRSITLDTTIADLKAQGVTDPVEMLDYLNFDESGALIGDVTLKEIKDSLKLQSEDLTGLSGSIKDFKTFFPNVKLDTTEGYQKYLRFKAQTAAAGRKTPTKPASDVSSTSGDLMTYEEWRTTPAAKAILQTKESAQMKKTGTSVLTTSSANAILKEKYDEAAMQYYRDNPSKAKNYTSSNIPPPLKELIVSDISSGATLSDLYDAYPDVSSSYLSSLYNSLKKKSSSSESSSVSDEDLKAFLSS